MAKLRLVIADRDEKYVQRLSDYITVHYGEKIEIFFFTQSELLRDFIRQNRVNGVFAGKEFLGIYNELDKKEMFGYLTEGIETDRQEGIQTLLKYQSADALVKEMLALCSEGISAVYQGTRAGGRGKVCLFESPAGGVGTSTVAAACTLYLAHRGRKVLYLSMEEFGTSETLFTGDGRFDFGDVIYALLSRKGNLELKIESVVKQDASGVYFIEPCRQAPDFMSLTVEGAEELFAVLMESGNYEYIVVDRGSRLTKLDYFLRTIAEGIFLVSDGTPITNEKLKKLCRAIEIYEESEDEAIREKMRVIYNRFGSQSGQRVELAGIKTFGGFPRYERIEQRKIAEQLAAKELFGKV